jgi:hypothetical protein
MKNYLICLLALFTVLSACSSESPESQRDYSEVNPIVGDLSSRLGSGLLSPENQTEQERVSSHLAFAEHVLRSRDVAHLSSNLQNRRAKMLDLLREYWQAGVYPGNYDHPGQRRPCFIDQRGNICAVGYLVEQTAGHDAASEINERFQYADISEMDHGSLDNWIAESGLSRDEVALIQPTYGYYPPTNPADVISPARSAFSAFFTGVGGGCSVLSVANMNNPGYSKALPAIGLGAGVIQTMMGIVPMLDESGPGNTANYRRQTLSMLNLGMGTANIFINAYSLIRKRPAKVKSTQFSMFSTPMDDKRMAWGVGLTRQF